MKISPVSQFSYSKINNSKVNHSQMNMKQQSFGSIGNMPIPGFNAENYTFGSPTVYSGSLEFRAHEMKDMYKIIAKLEKVSPEEQRDFLLNAKERTGSLAQPKYRHVAHALKAARKSEYDRKAFKVILDNALATKTRNEDPKKVAANSAYILEWFAVPCLPQDTELLDGYEYMQRDLIKQAKEDLNNPDWHPYVEAFHPEIPNSGAKY